MNFYQHAGIDENTFLVHASSYEPGDRAGSVARCSYGKFNPG